MTQTPKCHSDYEKETSNETALESIGHDDLTITVVISGIRFTRSLTNDLQTTEDRINEWLKAHPAKMAYWGAWCGRAEISAMAAKHHLQFVEADVYEKERKRLYDEFKDAHRQYFSLDKNAQTTEPKPKEPTMDTYKYAIKRHPEYQDAVRKHLQAEEVVRYMKAAVTALETMRFVLISLSANMRSERDAFSNVVKHGTEEAYSDVVQSFHDTVGATKTVGAVPTPSIPSTNISKQRQELPRAEDQTYRHPQIQQSLQQENAPLSSVPLPAQPTVPMKPPSSNSVIEKQTVLSAFSSGLPPSFSSSPIGVSAPPPGTNKIMNVNLEDSSKIPYENRPPTNDPDEPPW